MRDSGKRVKDLHDSADQDDVGCDINDLLVFRKHRGDLSSEGREYRQVDAANNERSKNGL